MEQVIFGIHTGTFKKWISLKEANAVKSFFGLAIDESLTDETHFYEKGITKLWIEEVSNKCGKRYYFHMKVNFSRVLEISNHKIMPYLIPNVKQSFKAIDKILKILLLSDNNSKFSTWTVERVDTAFDVYDEHPAYLMKSLNQSVDLSNKKKKCDLIEIKDKTPEQLVYESLRFGNSSYDYNIYVKLIELFDRAKKKNTTISIEELKEVRNILRIERQNHMNGIKKILPTMTAGDLANPRVRENILKTMIDEIGIFFGKDDCCSIYTRIIKEFPQPPDKRQYNSFPIPHQIGDGRYKATITLYSVDSGRKQIQIAGKTIEDFEAKVFRKLKETYLINRFYLKSNDLDKRNMISKSADYIKRFQKTAKTQTVKQDAERFIEAAILEDEKKFLEPNSTALGVLYKNQKN